MSAKAQIRLFGKKAFYNLCKGFEFNPAGWGGAGPAKRADGTSDNPYYRVKAPAKKIVDEVKATPMVFPAFPVLSGEADRVRTLAEHRRTVDNMGACYACGNDPLTGKPLGTAQMKVLENILKKAKPVKPWRSPRRNADCQDSEALALLTQAFELFNG